MVLDTEIFLWYPPAVSGKAPSARAGHSACLLGLPKSSDGGGADACWADARVSELVVFGGTRGRSWDGGLHVLNCDRWEWARPKVRDLRPFEQAPPTPPRLLPTLTPPLPLRLTHARGAQTFGPAPSPRSYHSATAICVASPAASEDRPSAMVLFGGNDGERTFNDVHVLSLTWASDGEAED